MLKANYGVITDIEDYPYYIRGSLSRLKWKYSTIQCLKTAKNRICRLKEPFGVLQPKLHLGKTLEHLRTHFLCEVIAPGIYTAILDCF